MDLEDAYQKLVAPFPRAAVAVILVQLIVAIVPSIVSMGNYGVYVANSLVIVTTPVFLFSTYENWRIGLIGVIQYFAITVILLAASGVPLLP